MAKSNDSKPVQQSNPHAEAEDRQLIPNGKVVGLRGEDPGGSAKVPVKSTEPVPGPPHVQEAGPKDPKKTSVWKSRAGRMWTLAVTVVTVITAVISVFPVLFKDESSVQSLKAAMKPYRAESVTHFALPVGAPIGSFPSGGTLCTQEQEEWLRRYGVQFQRDYLIELRNSAGGGGSLAVANIRGHATKSSPVGSAYIVECDKSGDSGVVAEPGRLLLDSGEPAFFDKTTLGAAGTGQPNSPLAYNLRPGETGQVVLSLSARSSFTGEVLTSVSAGDRTSDVKISLEDGGEIEVPGVLSPRTILVTVRDGKLNCNVIPNPTAQISSCTADDLFRR